MRDPDSWNDDIDGGPFSVVERKSDHRRVHRSNGDYVAPFMPLFGPELPEEMERERLMERLNEMTEGGF